MIHSQLKLKYPDCPYVINADKLNNTAQTVFDAETINNKTLFEKINENIDLDTLELITDFLNKTIENNESDFKIFYHSIKQPLTRSNKFIVNFHYSAYRDDVSPIINQNYSSDISWTIVPLNADVRMERISYTLNLMPQNQDREVTPDNSVSNLDPKSHLTTELNKDEKAVLYVRSAKRSTVVRDIESINEKKDLYSYPDVQTETKLEYKPLHSMVQLDSKTRPSAQLLRERLANPYKAYRLRNNPDAYKKSLKVDPGIREVGDKIVEANNDKRDLFKINELTSLFDYNYETVGVKKINGVFRCFPQNVGKISLSLDLLNKNFTELKFLSLMFNKSKLHITLHEITFK